MIYLIIISFCTINFEVLPGRDLVFLYVPQCLAQGLGWVGDFLLFLWDGPCVCITLRVTMSWKTRNTIFCCVRVRKVHLLREKS